MSDREKTRELLLEEVEQLRRKVALLEKGERDKSSHHVVLDSIARAVPDIIYRLDVQGNILFINDAIKQYGYEPEELIGTSIFPLIHPADRDKAVYRINERRTGDRSTRLLELRLLARNRPPVPFEFASVDEEIEPTLLISAEGIYSSGKPQSEDFLYTQGVARDISERKWASRALEMAKEDLSRKVVERTAELEGANQALKREVEERRKAERALLITQRAVDRAHEAIFWLGEDGCFSYVNEEATRMLGYSREEMMGMGLPELSPDFPRRENWPEVWEGVRRASEPRVLETRYRKKDGSLLPVEVVTSFLECEGEACVCNFVRDVSGRKRGEQKRRALEEQLRHSQKMEAVGQLVAGIAHNFNNMLQGVVGNLHLAHMDSPAGVRPFLEAAQEATDRAANMVRQLMLFTRQEIQIRRNPVDLHGMSRDAVQICRDTFDRRISIVERVTEGAFRVEGNADQLRQVLMNLLLNARDALEEKGEGEPVIRVGLEVVKRRMKGGDEESLFACLRVEDNGTGMDEETRRRIFEPFFTTKPVDKGIGLGLSTVYGIVEQHGGWIECESEPGRGTSMSVLLPIAGGETAKFDDGWKATTTVLIVDDEEVVRRSTARILERHGYGVRSAPGGREALEIFARERESIGLVILDLSMPEMEGREVLTQLLAIEPRVKVLIFTGYPARSEEFSGARAVIKKPFSMEALVGTVRALVEDADR